MSEIGYKSMKSGFWQGIYVPAQTPASIVKKLHAAFTKVLSDPEIQKRFEGNGAQVMVSKSPEEFAEFLKDENEKYAKVIQTVGIVME
ncbi:MAG: tripartite tricarboxylate transporter substrate-binding protein [Thermodesulfobacteriota bacterium]